MRFRRPCKDKNCQKMYRPTGKFTKYCDDCQDKRKKFGIKKKVDNMLIKQGKVAENG